MELWPWTIFGLKIALTWIYLVAPLSTASFGVGYYIRSPLPAVWILVGIGIVGLRAMPYIYSPIHGDMAEERYAGMLFVYFLPAYILFSFTFGAVIQFVQCWRNKRSARLVA